MYDVVWKERARNVVRLLDVVVVQNSSRQCLPSRLLSVSYSNSTFVLYGGGSIPMVELSLIHI